MRFVLLKIEPMRLSFLGAGVGVGLADGGWVRETAVAGLSERTGWDVVSGCRELEATVGVAVRDR